MGLRVLFGIVFGVFALAMIGLIVFVVRFGIREQRRANRAAGRGRAAKGEEPDLK